jgi:hypothetical protein
LLTRSRAYTRRLRDGNLAGGAQRAGRRQCTADAIGEDGESEAFMARRRGPASDRLQASPACKQAKGLTCQKSSKMQHVLACRVLA